MPVRLLGSHRQTAAFKACVTLADLFAHELVVAWGSRAGSSCSRWRSWGNS